MYGVALNGRQLADRGGVEVRGARVVDYDRRRRLLRHDLVRAGERRADCALDVEHPPHQLVLRQVGTRAVAPRIALAAPVAQAQLLANAAVRALRERFG